MPSAAPALPCALVSSPRPPFSRGLARVPRDVLEGLLRAAFRGRLPLPVTRAGLLASGFGAYEAELDAVVGLDERGLRVAIRVALDERDAGIVRAEVLGEVATSSPGPDAPADLIGARLAPLVATARADVLVAHHDAPAPTLRAALAAAADAGAHVAWVALPDTPTEAVAPLRAALPAGADLWLPVPAAPRRTPCVVVDGRAAVLGAVVPGPALSVDDAAVASSLRAAWRAALAADEYTLGAR
jgi:hypothetical protein